MLPVVGTVFKYKDLFFLLYSSFSFASEREDARISLYMMDFYQQKIMDEDICHDKNTQLLVDNRDCDICDDGYGTYKCNAKVRGFTDTAVGFCEFPEIEELPFLVGYACKYFFGGSVNTLGAVMTILHNYLIHVITNGGIFSQGFLVILKHLPQNY